ncbi:MAG: hypothetical protein ACYC6M_03010 [Terriglobales bacterium]
MAVDNTPPPAAPAPLELEPKKGPTLRVFEHMAHARLADGTSWSAPLDSLQHPLRYEEPTRSQLLVAAECLSAFDAIINAPAKRQREVLRAPRAALSLAGATDGD